MSDKLVKRKYVIKFFNKEGIIFHTLIREIEGGLSNWKIKKIAEKEKVGEYSKWQTDPIYDTP